MEMQMALELRQEQKNYDFNDPDQVIDYFCEKGDTPDNLMAVIRIIEDNEELKKHLLPHIDIHTEEVDWLKAGDRDYTDNGYAGYVWAKALHSGVDWAIEPFLSVKDMDDDMKLAVSEAVNIAWGVPHF